MSVRKGEAMTTTSAMTSAPTPQGRLTAQTSTPAPTRTASRASARTSTGVAAAVLLLAGLALGACSKSDAGSGFVGADPASSMAQEQAASTDSDTVDLVDAALTVPAVTTQAEAPNDAPFGDRRGLRLRLLRTLHATWVTEGASGPVTHEAIRGEVTAASATSITVKAKDGVSMTFAVTADTRVRSRANGRGTDSTMASVDVGQKALVVGTGASNPTARLVVFRIGTPTTAAPPSPSATS